MRAEARSRYLAFALKIRKLTDALITLAEEGTRDPQLEQHMKEVLAAVEGSGKTATVKSVRQRGQFGHYENVVTINEVVQREDRDALVQKLRGVITANTHEERRANAIEAIQFFDILESRALHHYSYPSVP